MSSNMQFDVLALNMEHQLLSLAEERFGKKLTECSDPEFYSLVLILCKRLLRVSEKNTGEKKVYYISAEFLVGRLLGNDLINMGLYDMLGDILHKYGRDLAALEELEREPSLGNGGLGRLAACFMDSIATLGLPGEGVGLNYHFGLFRQRFQRRMQVEETDPWIQGLCWEAPSSKYFDVKFGKGSVRARLYNMEIVGYQGGTNKLRLFDLDTVDESLVRSGISFDKTDYSRNLTLFVYPDDSDENGIRLRVYQQYFLASCAAQLILQEMKERQYDLYRLPDHAVVQINDTHPVMIIPELIRILIEEKGMDYDLAVEAVRKTCAYTNHTIMAEALETWPVSYLEEIVPGLLPVIRELDRRVRISCSDPRVWIIDEKGLVHMPYIALHYCFSVNGVSSIHTQILEETEMRPFYELYPERFSNKTNGITIRRWLISCNRELGAYVSSLIGDSFRRDGRLLEKLMKYRDDPEVLGDLEEIKLHAKETFCAWVEKKEGIRLDPEGIFDVQTKEIHGYKRQQLFALYIIHRYLEVREGKRPVRPINFIAGGKAAPAYTFAKDVLHLLLVLQDLINHDPLVSRDLHMAVLTDYNVTCAEKVIPACDISEQISLASREASGTGSMKFMLNGAVTLGTEDGSNAEIHELVGDDNIYIFGAGKDRVIGLLREGSYDPGALYRSDPVIRRAVDFILSPAVCSLGSGEILSRLHRELISSDRFMALLDMEDYIRVKDRMIDDYEDRDKWRRMMLINIARAGYFSSDRTVGEYNEEIWHLQGDKRPLEWI